MYSIAIADDESAIRNGLATHIEWTKMGFAVAGVFEDGEELIEYLKSDPVDVVLTDIRMSSVSGLEVARYVREHHPQTKVVVVSGYRDFEYAREAMQHGVKHYLLKPTLPEEIASTFHAVRDELAQSAKRSSTGIVNDVRRRRHSFLYAMLSHVFVSDRDLLEEWNQSLLPDFGETESVSYCRFPSVTSAAGMASAVESGLESLGLTAIAVTEGSDTVHALVVREQPGAPSVYSAVSELPIDESVTSITEFHQSGFFVAARSPAAAESAAIAARRHALLEDDAQTRRRAIRSLMDELLEYPQPILVLRRLAVRVIRQLADRSNDELDHSHLFKAGDREEVVECLARQLQSVGRRTMSVDTLLDRLDRFLESRLHEDLSLSRVARAFHFSTTHFSRIVKRLSGVTFVSYVRSRRMECARVLLLKGPGRAVKEIAVSLGYCDAKYFSRQFRAEIGMTPTEYRRSTRGRDAG